MPLHITNPVLFEKKITALRQSGHAQIHVLADFDRTLTKAFVKGKTVHSTYALLREGGYLGPDYARRAYQEYETYHPYENDTSLPLLLRQQKMEKWWTEHWNLLVACGITKQIFKDIVAKGHVELRHGCLEFFALLKRYHIPLLIFSSGLGDLIQYVLQHHRLLSSNVHLIANFFEWNSDGKAVGYRKPLVHSLNKNEVEIKTTPYAREVQKRRNVLLLGDSLGDSGMAEGLEHDIVLRLGFLNSDMAQHQPAYKQAFDGLIKDDVAIWPVVELLKKVLIGPPRL